MPGEIAGELGVPGIETGEPFGWGIFELGFELMDFVLERGALGLLLGSKEAVEGGFVFFVGVGGLVEEVVELVVFGDGDGVVFVGVALCAGDGGAHPDGHGGVDAVDDGGVAEFFVAGAALVLGHGVAMEGGGDELVLGGLGEEVAGELVDGELVEGLIAVEGGDDPVAPGPDFAGLVGGVAGGVGVAGEVHPLGGPVFAVGGLGEVVVDDGGVVGCDEGEEAVDFFGSRGEAGEVEGEAAEEGVRWGFGREGEFFLGEAGEEEGVDWMGCGRGWEGFFDGFVGPVFAPGGALFDPLGEEGDLGGGDDFVELRRGHDLVGVGGEDALEEGTFFGVTGDDGDGAIVVGLGGGFVVEAEAGFAFGFVGTVTEEAVFGEDGTDLAAEVDGIGEGGCGAEG